MPSINLATAKNHLNVGRHEVDDAIEEFAPVSSTNLIAAKANLTTARNKVDDGIAEFNALETERDTLQTNLTTVTGERDTAESARLAAEASLSTAQTALTTAQDELQESNDALAVAMNNCSALQLDLSAAQGQCVTLQTTIGNLETQLAGALAEITRLNDLLNASGEPPFIVYNEMKSTGSMVDLGLQDIRFIYESNLHPTDDHTLPPDVDFLRTRFAQIKAEDPDIDMVVLNQEAWLKKEVNGTTQDGKFTAVNVPYYVTIVNVAKEFFRKVAVYMFPERTTSFLTGSNAGDPSENDLRLEGLYDRTEVARPLLDAVTFFVPSFYYINPCHLDAVKRDLWISTYIQMIRTLAPGKPIIPALGARYHPSVPQVELRMTYIPGDYWRATMEHVKAVGCAGLIIWAKDDAPDPRDESPEPAYWTETKDFIADHGLASLNP